MVAPAWVLAEQKTSNTGYGADVADYSGLIFEAEWIAPAMSSLADEKLAPVAAESANANSEAAGSALAKVNRFNADVADYQARTNQLLAEGGPFSIRLREQYEKLGVLLQKAGEHARAISAFESAVQIDRVNDGLYTPRQIPLIRNIIDSYVALSNWQEVARRHEYLYMVQMRNYAPESGEGLSAQEELADWNVQYYLNENANQFYNRGKFQLSGNTAWVQPEYVLTLNRASGRYIYAPRARLSTMLNLEGTLSDEPLRDFYNYRPAFEVTPEAMVDERLRRARDIYQNIIAGPNAGFRRVHNVRLTHKLANVGITVKRQLDGLDADVGNLPDDSDDADNDTLFNRLLVFPQSNNPVIQAAYASGRDSLQAIAEQLRQDANSNRIDTAKAYLNLGDWHLSFSHPHSSVAAYETALRLLQESGCSQAEIAQLFNPSPLVPVPVFAVHPYSRQQNVLAADRPLHNDGNIDLHLTLTQSGTVKAAHIIAATPAASPQLQQLLINYLRHQPMRPWAVDGKLAKTSDVAVRIHYAY